MPRYVYQNLETGEQYEFEQGYHEPAYTHHPETGAPIKRLIFAPAVVFKGFGLVHQRLQGPDQHQRFPQHRLEYLQHR